LSAPTDVLVDWQTIDGTRSSVFPNMAPPPDDLRIGSDYAVAGVDYTATGNQTLTFSASGAIFQDVTVNLLTDSIPEFNKDVFIRATRKRDPGTGNTLQTAPAFPAFFIGAGHPITGGFYQMPGACSVTIVDDDQPAGALDRAWNLDNNFNTIPPFNTLPGANNTVNGVALQTNGQAIIVGDFTDYNTQPANRIARVTAAGFFDSTFAVGQGADNFVSTVATYTNGTQLDKIVIGGGFTAFNGVSRNRIARLNTDGSLDTTFDPGSGFNGPVRAVAVQSDGKVIVGGSFTTYNSASVSNLARLNSNGSLDTSFNSGSGPNNTVYAVAVDSAGRVVFGGDFTSYAGTNRNRIARALTTGLVDTTFDPGTGADNSVRAIYVESGDKVLLGGDFLTFRQLSRVRIARVLVTGALDTTFDPGAGANNTINAIGVATNGQFFVAGAFTTYDGSARKNLLRLFTNGVLDTTFMDTLLNWNSGPTNTTSFLTSIAVQSDNNLMVGGSFTGFGAPFSRTTGTTPDHGLVAPSTDSGGANDNNPNTGNMRWTHTKPRQNLARVLGHTTPGPGNIEFEFGAYSVSESATSASVRVQRINTTGVAPASVLVRSADGSASSGVDYLGVTNSLNYFASGGFARELRAAESSILAGSFNSTVYLTNLGDTLPEPNETINLSLTTLGLGSSVAAADVNSAIVDANGNILLGGEFASYGRAPGSMRLAQVGPGGYFNTNTFNLGYGANNTIRAVAAYPSFSGANGTVRAVAAYLNNFGANSTINAAVTYTNGTHVGKTVIVGTFTTVNGIPLNHVARLNADGTLDTRFSPGNGAAGATATPLAVGLDSVGNVIVGGDFTSFNGTPSVRVVRLAAANGAVDTGFSAALAAGANLAVRSVAVDATDGVVIGGEFNGLGFASTVSNRQLDSVTNATITTAANHGLVAGNPVTVAGVDGVFNGTFTVKSATATTFTYSRSITASITNKLAGAGTATLTTDGTHSFVASDVIVVTGVDAALDGAQVVTIVGANTITFASAATVATSPVSPAGLVQKAFSASVNNKSLTSNIAELTTTAAHNLPVGAVVVINIGDAVFDGTNTITATPTPTTFRYTRVNSDVGSTAALGPVALVSRPSAAATGTATLNVSVSRLARLTSSGALDGAFTANLGSGLGAVSVTANTRQMVAGTATLTTTAAHGFAVGDTVIVNINDPNFNGTFVLGAGTAGSTLVYTVGGPPPDVGPPPQPATGTVQRGTVNALAINGAGTITLGGQFTGTSFSANAATKGLTNNTATIVTATPHGLTTGHQVTIAGVDANFNTTANVTVVNSTTFTYARLLTASVVNRQRTANVATLTTSIAHGFLVGDTVTITGVDATFNGTFVLIAGTAGSTLVYDNATNPNVGSTAVSPAGTANKEIATVAATGTASLTAGASHLARVSSAGTFDAEFSRVFNGVTDGVTVGGATVRALTLAGTGVIIAGSFTAADGVASVNVAQVSATGVVDPTFGSNLGAGPNGTVRAMARDSAGRLVVGGDFTAIGSSTNSVRLSRLSVNGSVDASFYPGSGANASVRTITLDLSERIFAAGDFTIFNGTTVNRYTRLVTGPIAGALDLTYSLAPQAGKFIIAGDFTSVHGVSVTNVARINADGTVDQTFRVGTGASNGVINAVAIHPGGRVFVGGGFTSFNGQANSARLVALNSLDGVVDTVFATAIGNGPNLPVHALTLDSSGGLYLGGDFTSFNSTPNIRLAKLNGTTYAVDATFRNNIGFLGSGGFNNTVRAIALSGTPTAVVYVGGDFTSMNGASGTVRVVKLSSNGSLDAFFAGGITTGPNGTVNSIAVDGTTNVVIAGSFTFYNGVGSVRVARITNSTAALDTTFAANLGSGPNDTVRSIVWDGATTFMLGGDFTSINGVANSSRAARINGGGAAAGTPFTLHNGTGPAAPVRSLAFDVSGRVIAGGEFQSVGIASGPVTLGRVARFTTGGTLDGTFLPIHANKYVVVGDFTQINGLNITNVARLTAAGAVDINFNNSPSASYFGGAFGGTVNAVAIDRSGNVLIGGDFTSFMSQGNTIRIARLLVSSGVVDPTFSATVTTGPNAAVHALSLDTNGNIFIGGDFTTYNNLVARRLVRLDGDTRIINPVFNAAIGAGFNATVRALTVTGTTLMAGGDFTDMNSQPNTTRIVRLSTAGVLDTAFNPGTGPNGSVRTIALDGLNNVFLGGDFTAVNGVTVGRIAKLLASGALDTSFNLTGSGADSTVRTIVRDGSGRLIVVGLFGSFNSAANSSRVLRLDENSGALDTFFATGVGTGPQTGGGTFELGGQVTVVNNIALGFQRTAVLSITDDDFLRGELTFSATNFSALESAGTATINVFRTNGSVGAVTVDFVATNSTSGSTIATAVSDFTVTSGTLNFAAGETNKSFTVSILNDAEVENDETINLILTNPTGGASVSGATATLTIVDDDLAAGRLSLNATSYTVAENAGSLQVVVNRTGGSVGTATATFQTQNGTALHGTNSLDPGKHYRGTTNALSWGNGDASSRTITITNFDNLLVTNATLTFTVELVSITGAGAGNVTNATVSITEDDAFGTVAFSQPAYAVAENGGAAIITVVRTGGRGGTVPFDYATSPGSALAGVDFTNTNGSSRLDPGATSTNFTVPITDNQVANANKTVNLSLSGVVNGALAFGTLDSTFLPARLGANGIVRAVAAYTTGPHAGKYVIAGDFTSVNGVLRTNVARLNPDGSVDNSFTANTVLAADAFINTVALDASGNILVGGSFTNIGGTASTNLARLAVADGTVDGAFATALGTGPNAAVEVLVLDGSGNIYVGGSFTNFNATAGVSRLAKLSNDGTLDPAFNTALGTGFTNGAVRALAVSGTTLYVGGDFTNLNSRVGTTRLVKLTTAGALDASFASGISSGPNGSVRGIVIEAASVVIAGDFTTYNGSTSVRLARLNANTAALDTSFATVLGSGANGLVRGFARDGSGRYVLAGDFTAVNGALNTARAARLTTSGAVDSTFNPGSGPDAVVRSLALDGAGRAFIGGDFTSANGSTQNRFTRLSSAGAVDGTFASGAEITGTVSATARQTDGKLLIAGSFTAVSGISRNGIARLNTDGSLDTTFNPGTGVAGGAVNAVFVDASGNVIIGGSFTSVSGAGNTAYLAMLTTAGAVDATFAGNLAGGGLNGAVNALATNSAGRLLVGGDFTTVNGLLYARLVLLDATGGTRGLPAAVFDDPNITGGAVNSIAVESGGTIIIGGAFTSAGSQGRNGVARLSAVGVVDTPTFTGFGTGVAGGAVNAVVAESSGRILIGGAFTNVNGTTMNRVARLNADGSLDTSTFTGFTGALGGTAGVRSLLVDPSTGGNTNKITLVGDFTTVNGSARTGFARLNPDGSLDSSVGTVTLAGGSLFGQVLQTNDNLVLVGNFTTVNGAGRTSIVRLGGSMAVLTILDDESQNIPAGSIDTLFSPGSGANNFVQAMVRQTNGSLIIGGDFTQFNSVARTRLARLTSSGSLDGTFLASGAGFNAAIRALALQLDGRVMVGGAFTTVNGTNRNYVVRLNIDGTVDSSFSPGAAADNPVNSIAVYTSGAHSGKIVLGGAFSAYNGTTRNFLARVNSDGSLDAGFDIGTGANGTVHAVAIQTDGKVLVGGDFTSFNGTNRANLIRLNADGSVDTAFNAAGAGGNGSVRAITVQSDNKVLIGGLFTTYNGTASPFIARVLIDGTVDASFNTGDGADNAVYAIALQDDGKIVVGGDFTSFSGVTRNRIHRLNANGTLDPTINFGTGANSFVAAVLLQRNSSNLEQLALAGGFTVFNGSPARYVTRLNGGSLAGAGRTQFSSANYSVNENGTNAVITVVRTGGTTGMATNTLSVTGGTAENGTHYSFATTNLAFLEGENLRTVTLNVTNDAIVNTDRTVLLRLANFSPVSATEGPGNQTNATLTIVNDEALVGFSASSYTVNESVVGGQAVITVTRVGSTVGLASASFFTVGGTATASTDYTNASGVLTFASGETVKTFTVSVVSDSLVEGNETVLLLLTNLSGAVGNITTATLTIVDDDFAPGELNFSAPTYSVNESAGLATLTVTRTNGFTGVVSVNYATVGGGTAINGIDYNVTNGTLAFADGQTTRTFNVGILVNIGSTNNPTINLQISDPTGGATLGSQSVAILTITNNDLVFGTFNFTNTVYTFSENVGTATIGVDRGTNATSAVGVSVVLANGSATNGVHYTGAVTNDLGWNDGEQGIKPFTITIINNSLVSGDKSLTMTLVNPTNGASIGLTNSATLTILDDEVAAGDFSFALTSFTVLENATNALVSIFRTTGFTATNAIVVTNAVKSDGVVTLTASNTHGVAVGNRVTVALNNTNYDGTFTVAEVNAENRTLKYEFAGPPASSVTAGFVTNLVQVTFYTTDSTARHGPDYTGVTNLLVFANGQTNTNVFVAVLDNLSIAGNKALNLHLTNAAGGATIISPSNALLIIVDNDPFSGTGDGGFNPGLGPNAAVRVLGVISTGQLVAGGDFTTYNGVGVTNVVRLQPNGDRDPGFAVPPMVNGASSATIRTLAVQAGDRVIIGGRFTSIGGVNRANIARLTTAGTLDEGFAPIGANNVVNSVVVLSNGRVLVGGEFTTIAGGTRNFIAQLLDNGTLDPSFNSGTGADGTVRVIAVQGDGKVLIGGDFTSYDGTPRAYLARVAVTGEIDPSFPVGANLNGPVSAIRVQTDGKILIGGSFTAHGTTPRNYLARLNSDGSLDDTFYNTGTELNNFVSTIDVQSDGSVVIGGGFTAFGTVSRNRFMRLTSTGGLDPTINVGTGPDNFVSAVLVQNDGRIALGGLFRSFNGSPAPFITRIHGGINLGEGIVGFNAPTSTVTENDSSVTFTVLRTAGTSNNIAVNYSFANVSATNGGVHYNGEGGTLSFATGQTMTNFSASIFDDEFVTNANRTFEAHLSGLVSLNGTASLGISTNTVTIVDNDANLNFSAATYSVSEADPVIEIKVNRLAGRGNAYTVQYTTSDGSALAGTHYLTNSGTLAWADSDTAFKTFNVQISPNDQTNGNLTVNLSLASAMNVTLGKATPLSGRTNAVLTIVDDEFGPGLIGFSRAAYSIGENQTNVTITVLRTNGNVGPMSVNYATVAGGTAVAVTHFTNTSGTFSWADGDSTPRTFTVGVKDDAVINDSRTVNLRLSSFVGGSDIGITNAVLTITDDDTFGTFQFSTNTFTVTEGDGSVMIVINRIGGSIGSVSVDVVSSNLTASAGLDYILVQQRLDFVPGQTSSNMAIQLINDQVVELPESFSLVLTNATGGALLGAITNATVLIADDDMQFSYALTNFNIQENANLGFVSVIRYGVTNVSGTVDFATANGTALHGVDYTGVTNTLIFLPGVTNTNFSVVIADNSVVQQNRFVSLSLFNPTAMNIASVGTNATATMTIVDNDNSFSFSSTNYSVNEAVGLFGVSVLRFGQNTGVVSVAVSTLALVGPGAATTNSDYVNVSSTLSFAVGQSNLLFNVPIISDLLPEGNESFGVSLANPQPAGASQLGPTNAAIVTIVDDDIGIGFSAATYSVAESAGAQTITIVRAGATNVQVGVSFATTNGTAVAGVDYVATNATFAFAAGVTNRTFTVSVINDSVSETSETVLLGLFAPTGGAFLTTSNAVLTIVDNVGSVGFSVTNFLVNENSTNGVVFVTRSGGSFGAITVQYLTIVGGNATSGLDYEDVNGTISWNDGESGAKSFTVPVYNDQLIEPTETIALRLTQASGGASLSVSNATLSIVDNDGPGGVDFAFDPGVGFDSSVYALAQQSNGQLLAAGRFTSFGATNRNRVARLNFDGTLDATYNLGLGPDNAVNAVALQPDGRLVIGGDFTSVGGTIRNRVARLLVDGSIDNSFNPGSGANSGVNSVALQADGKVLIGGSFTNYNGIHTTNCTRIARLNTSGSLDTTFGQGTGANGFVNALAVYGSGTNAGKILVGGSFTTFNGSTVNRLVRLTASGTIDPTFNTGTGANGTVASIAIQPDGKLVLGGLFSTINGVARARMARINQDGSLDATFFPVMNDTVLSVVVQPDGRILAGGAFTSINGDTGAPPSPGTTVSLRERSAGVATLTTTAAHNLAAGSRVTIAGVGDGYNGISTVTAVPSPTRFSYVSAGANEVATAVIPNGAFSAAGTAAGRIARFLPDGALDSTFTTGTGADNLVFTVLLQTDFKVALGGDFTTVNSATRGRIARLNGNSNTPIGTTLGSAGFTAGQFTVGLSAEPGRTYRIEFTTNFVSWSVLTTVSSRHGTITFTDTSSSGSARRFYRAIQLP